MTPNQQSNRLNALMEKYPKNINLGMYNGEFVNLRRPSFDCNWYWGFGYIGNQNMHTHLNWLSDRKNIHMRDAIKESFGDTFCIKDKQLLWQFIEIVNTVYALTQSAEVFGRGGSHNTTNPDAELIRNQELVNHINDVLIPAQIDSMYKCFDVNL